MCLLSFSRRMQRKRSHRASTESLFRTTVCFCVVRLFQRLTDVGIRKGGRQVDGAIGSLDALDKIMRSCKVRAAQKSGKLTVLFDSGIRTGSDIIKALAIGAQGVLSQFSSSF